MALLGYQIPSITGTPVAFVAADVAGDRFPANDHAALLVKNDAAAPITVTIAVPGNTKYGQPQPDVTATVAAGTTRAIGPFPVDLRDTDGSVHVTYSSVASVTVAAIAV